MRYLLGLFLTVACVTAFVPPSKPQIKAVAVSVRRDAVASVVWVKWTLVSTGSPDSTTADVTGPTNLHRKYVAATKVDSVSYPAPAPNGTISGGVTATAWRRGLPSAPMAPKPWSYTEPDVAPPQPGVTVEIIPASATVAPGGSVQFQVSTNSGKPVVWTLEGPGTLSQTGRYTAPL